MDNKIIRNHRGRDYIVQGSFEFLMEHFKYQLLQGHDLDSRIPIDPKNIDELIKALRQLEKLRPIQDRSYYILD